MASTDVTKVLQLLIDVQLGLRIRMSSASVDGDFVCDMARGQEQLEDRTKATVWDEGSKHDVMYPAVLMRCESDMIF